MMASMVLSSNLDTYFGLDASCIHFHETGGLFLMLFSAEDEENAILSSLPEDVGDESFD
jgi:hypothetical protein